MFDLGKALYGRNLIGIVATFVLYALAHDTLRSALSLPGEELAFAVVVFLGFVMLIGSLLGAVSQLLWWGFRWLFSFGVASRLTNRLRFHLVVMDESGPRACITTLSLLVATFLGASSFGKRGLLGFSLVGYGLLAVASGVEPILRLLGRGLVGFLRLRRLPGLANVEIRIGLESGKGMVVRLPWPVVLATLEEYGWKRSGATDEHEDWLLFKR